MQGASKANKFWQRYSAIMDYCTGQMMNGKAGKQMVGFTKSRAQFPGRSGKK
jgi:hypothetical protein